MYGAEPKIIENISLEVNEMMFYMYLPIKLKGQKTIKFTEVPKRLKMILSFLTRTNWDYINNFGEITDKYIYLTIKHMYVTPDNPGNRPGWHTDGFGTNDINYIWTDKHPTIFNIDKLDLSTDCDLSMKQMNELCKEKNNVSYKENDLIRLDQFNIHKCPELTEGCMRTFVKISYSDHKYNLKGNSHNYLLDYDWNMHDRDEVRNHPTNKEKDHV